MAIPITYSLRSLVVRKATTIATALGIALVVFVLSSVMMLVNGIKKTLSSAGNPSTVIVLAQGSGSELESNFDNTSANLVLSQPGVAKEGTAPIGVAELVVVISLDKVGTDGFSNVAVRGISDGSIKFRPSLKIIEGTSPKPGTDEVIIGKGLRGRFKGLEIGQSVELRRGRTVRVVGVFEDAGSSNESEIWADLKTLQSTFGRENQISTVRARLESTSAFDAFQAAVEHDKRLGLKAWREPDYLEAVTAGVTPLVTILGGAISFFFGIGATLGAMVTMYGAVSNRIREIGTLRALGFSRSAVMTAFVFEAVFLTGIGGIIGVVASLGMMFAHFTMLAGNWSEITFTFDPTPQIIITALAFGGGMGLLGGLLPAISASRILPAVAMRAR